MGRYKRGMKTRLLVVALASVSIVAAAAIGYGVRTRDIAIRADHSARASEAVAVAAKAGVAAKLQQSREVAEDSYRSLWEFLIKKPGANDLTFALAVNDYIHNNVPLGSSGDVPGSIPERLTNAFMKGGERAICGDYSTFLQMVLQTSGIPARTVQLASKEFAETGNAKAPTHVTVEALIDGRWILVDPTFDATFSCEGDPRLLGLDEARQCPKLVYNQHPNTIQKPERQVATHPFNFPDLLDYSVTASTWVDGKPVKWFGYPTADWLPQAKAMQTTRASLAQ